MKHVMIDIETLDTLPSAAILEISAQYFDPFSNEVSKALTKSIDFDLMAVNRSISGSTLKWWMGQSDEARDHIMKGQESLPSALMGLSCHIKNKEEALIWSKGPSFDVTILENAYAEYRMVPPWKYYNLRCVRTLLDLVEQDTSFRGIRHTSRADVAHQIRQVQQAYKKLGLKDD